MARKSLRPFADRLIEGGLRPHLERERNEGYSYESIARRLHDEHDIDVTGETVRAWCHEYGLTETAGDAA